jgi:polysaccharide biosynthesis/export protein
VARRRLALCLPVLLIVPLLTAQAQTQTQSQQQQQQQQTPEKPPEAPKVLPNSVGKDNAGAPVDPNTYVIGAEDVLYIGVFHEQEMSRAVSVRPDGKITMPLIGDLQAEGLTPERLRNQLRQALTSYMNDPDVTVTVVSPNSKRYTITGEVMRPGQYPLIVKTKVFEALSNAGGFRDFANTKKIVIIRAQERIKFNYQEVLKGKKLEQNIYLEPGDIINVP